MNPLQEAQDFIAHYGVKGMHWGVRNARRSGPPSSDYKKTAGLRKKRAHELTNKQLKDLNERRNLEQNFHRLNPRAIARGMAFAGTILGAAGMGLRMYDIYNHKATQSGLAGTKHLLKQRKKLSEMRKLNKGYQQLQLFKP